MTPEFGTPELCLTLLSQNVSPNALSIMPFVIDKNQDDMLYSKRKLYRFLTTLRFNVQFNIFPHVLFKHIDVLEPRVNVRGSVFVRCPKIFPKFLFLSHNQNKGCSSFYT